jgi:hypothetical protein
MIRCTSLVSPEFFKQREIANATGSGFALHTNEGSDSWMGNFIALIQSQGDCVYQEYWTPVAQVPAPTQYLSSMLSGGIGRDHRSTASVVLTRHLKMLLGKSLLDISPGRSSRFGVQMVRERDVLQLCSRAKGRGR